MRSGTKLLRIGSLLQILFGAGYFLLARFLLGEGDVALGGMSGEGALMTVLISYGGCAFQVLAGLVGLALVNRKSLLTVIFGVLLYFRTRHKQVFDQVFGMQAVAFIVLNLAGGFLGSGIDNLGHIGGLIGGCCAAYTVGLYRERPTWKRVLAGAGLLLLSAALFAIGYLRGLRFLLTGPI